MTMRVQSELRIEVTDENGTLGYEAFRNFSLSPSPDYTLHISEWSGNIGNNTHGLRDHNNTVFSTNDHDRDGLSLFNCGYNWEGVYKVIVALIYTCIFTVVDTKDCYVCTNKPNIQQCNNTVRCLDGQSCYQNVTKAGQQRIYNLGCVANAQCVSHHPTSSMIVGRSNGKRQTQNCLECCSSDLCNINLCNHTQPSVCMDDESLDCARLSSLFDVCKDVHQAKTTCPKFCGLCNLVDGNWGSWTDWSACDVTCENGTETRTRTCSNPSPAHGGLDCQGQSLEVKTCQKPLCPVHGGWSGWSSWGTCSVSCGVGLQERTRNCSNPAPLRFGDHCFGKNADMMICMSYTCAVPGWSDWSAWSSCYSSDGKSGTRSRYRECNNPAPSPFGKPCRGLPMQLSLCLVM